jgi:hypothetical protein
MHAHRLITLLEVVVVGLELGFESLGGSALAGRFD